MTTVLALFHLSICAAATPFDETKRAILPSNDAATFLRWYFPEGAWTTSEWQVTNEDLDRLEVGLAKALKKTWPQSTASRRQGFYRQYMPASWKHHRIIVVNAFSEIPSQMFPDKGIDSSQWEREPIIAFGGGCGFWRAVYVADQDRFLTLKLSGSVAVIMCNAPK